MSKLTSIYLDLLRIFAAFGVFFHHCNFPWFSNNFFFDEDKGHKLVAIFFVMSGFLIAYSVENKEKDFKIYMIDRLSRLYSVVIPAIILTYFLDSIGRSFDPVLYQNLAPENNQIIRALSSLLFLNQIQGFCIKPSTNIPFWSIGYEFWYYLLFGITILYRNIYVKTILILLLLFLMGIKILLLFPVWIFGVFAFYLTKKINFKDNGVLFIISLSSVLYFTFLYTVESNQSITIFNKNINLYFSYYYKFDLWYGLLVAITIFAVAKLNLEFSKLTLFEKIIKSISSTTFSLYLFHFPLLIFAAAVIPYDKNNIYQVFIVIIFILSIIYVLSIFTESKRNSYKIFLRIIFEKLLNIKLKLESKFSR